MSLSTKAQATVKAKWDKAMHAAQAAATSKRKPAQPVGMTAREVAVALGKGDRKGIARVAALLSKAWQYGKLDRDEIEGLLRYKPNAHTGIDFRVTTRTPTGQSARPESHARVQPKSAPAKPSAQQAAHITSLFDKPTPRIRATDQGETVEAFCARGGVIQRLAPGECTRRLASYAADDNFPL